MNFGVFIKIFLTFTFSQQLRFDVAEVFGLLKVKLNLKICTRRKPPLIFFLKEVVIIKIMNKNSKNTCKQFIFRCFNSRACNFTEK